MTEDDLFEKLAAIEHQRWADWQRYVHGQSTKQQNGSLLIPFDLVERWTRQINTDYADLSEAEKEADRDQVLRYWHLIKPVESR